MENPTAQQAPQAGPQHAPQQYASAAHGGDAQAAGPPFKVYVAGVPKSFAAEDLQPYFEKFGGVASTVILVEKGGSGLSRGCAFVNFATHEAATAAISAMDNQVILPGGPYNLRVRFANRPSDRPPLSAGPAASLSEEDRRRIFFTRGPPGVAAATITDVFSPYGDIEETNLFPDKVTGTTKGCGFVTFKSQEQATNAMAALNGTLQLPGVATPMAISWADPERRQALKRKFAGETEPERQVFFAKVPRAATENDVMALFAGLGAVEDVVLFKASGAQHHKGCGLATFQDHQSAADAILALDGIYMWPNFHDPMVVKWMDRSLQKNKRPDGSWAAWPAQQGGQQQPQQGYGQAPAPAPAYTTPEQQQAAAQTAQQQWEQWQHSRGGAAGGQQDWQAPETGGYNGQYASWDGGAGQSGQYPPPDAGQALYAGQQYGGQQSYSGQPAAYAAPAPQGQQGYANWDAGSQGGGRYAAAPGQQPAGAYAPASSQQGGYGQPPPAQGAYGQGAYGAPPPQEQHYQAPGGAPASQYSSQSDWQPQPPGSYSNPPPAYGPPGAANGGPPPANGSYSAPPGDYSAPAPQGGYSAALPQGGYSGPPPQQAPGGGYFPAAPLFPLQQGGPGGDAGGPPPAQPPGYSSGYGGPAASGAPPAAPPPAAGAYPPRRY